MPYLFGGLEIETELVFDHLRRSDGEGGRRRLVLRRRPGAAPREKVLHRSEGRYRLSCGRAGQDWVFRSRFGDAFVFDPARRRIDCHVASTGDEAWHDVLFRRVLPRVATTDGALAFHAAAIALEDRSVLLLGRSGAGKSTLTTHAATAGWDVLSDDTTLIRVDERIVADPVQHGMGVWDDTRRALALPMRDCSPMVGYDGRKWWFRPAAATAAAASPPLSAIVTLERAAVAAPVLVPLAADEVLPLVMAQDIPFLPDAPPGAATAQAFGRLRALVRRVPGFRLVYPDDYAALPAVEAMLRRLPPAAA